MLPFKRVENSHKVLNVLEIEEKPPLMHLGRNLFVFVVKSRSSAVVNFRPEVANGPHFLLHLNQLGLGHHQTVAQITDAAEA